MFIRIVGVIIGYKMLGFLGGLLGFFIAGAIHRYIAYGLGAVNPLSSGNRQEVFLKTLFNLMGKLAKSDGRVSESEIAHAQALMNQLKMTPSHKKEAIDYFREGTKEDFEICLLYTSPSPRDLSTSRMPSSA